MKPRSLPLLLSPLTALLYITSLTNAQTSPACPSTLNNFVLLDESTVFYYALLPSTATGSNDPPNGILCGRVEHEGEGWISLAVAQTADEMVGGEAIIGLPDENSVLKYEMTGKSTNFVTPMAESMQTLWDESIVQEDGKTIMTFAKWLVEENELEIAEGRNDFLFASGSSNTLAYHAARMGISVDLMAGEWDVLTTTTSTEAAMMDETTTLTTTESAMTTDVTTIAAATTDIATTTEAPMMNDPTTEATIATSEAASTEAATTTDAIATTLTTTTIASEGLDCTVDFCENELTSGYLQRYKVNIPEGQDPENCEGCSILMELIFEGEAWLSIGFSEDGNMIGSEAVIGVPGGTPQKYIMNGYALNLVELLPEEQQTLTDASITATNGQTIMKFTKLMSEPGEIEILFGDNEFLWAHGSDATLAYHGNNRAAFSLDLAAAGAAVAEEEVTDPTDPSVEVEEDSVNVPDAIQDPSGGQDCTVNFCDNELTTGFLQKYRINVPDGQAPETCDGCTIDMELIYDGEAWVSIGFSLNGRMIGSEAVIGIPGSTTLKYNLNGYTDNLVQPMPQEQQTLTDASTVFQNGQTIMKFTKIMKEPGEVEILFGDNDFLWAHGSAPALTYHASRSAFVLNLSSGAAQELTAPNKGLWLAHGVMLFLAWGVFVPFAVQASLLRKLLPEGGIWLQIHRGLNTISLALFIAGFAISVATTKKEEQPHFSNPHRRMGLAMFIMAILQVIGGIVRPHNPLEGEKKKPVRVGWEVGHRVLGVSLLACGFWQMYEGILLYGVKYSTDESDEEAITIAYWVWISVMIAVMVLGGAFFKLRK